MTSAAHTSRRKRGPHPATQTSRQSSTQSRHALHHKVIGTAQRFTPRLRRLSEIRANYRLDRQPWPTLGAVAAGGAGLALAMSTGVTELAVGGALAYAAYRMLRDGVSPRVAFRQGVTLERDAMEGKKFKK